MATMGRQYRGGDLVITSPEEVERARQRQAEFASPDAISLDAYFVRRDIRDDADRAARRAYVKPLENATIEAWDSLFINF